jgi:hypothetical protein
MTRRFQQGSHCTRIFFDSYGSLQQRITMDLPL